jgi:hypothetical protein
LFEYCDLPYATRVSVDLSDSGGSSAVLTKITPSLLTSQLPDSSGPTSAGTALTVLTNLSSPPERTRISYHTLLARTACAARRKASRMNFINATGLHRKSGGAQWRDLRFPHPPRCFHLANVFSATGNQLLTLAGPDRLCTACTRVSLRCFEGIAIVLKCLCEQRE